MGKAASSQSASANGPSNAVDAVSIGSKMRSPKYAADFLDVSPATVFRMLADGRIKSVLIGKSRRITDTELDRVSREGA
jgi:excisionase family DNA binding protein